MARSVNPFGDGHAAAKYCPGAAGLRKTNLDDMKDYSNTIIGIIPNVRGVGGPASFNEKLEIGLTQVGVEVTYDLARTDLSSVLVIAGTRHLGVLSKIKDRGIPIVQRLDGMNWVHRKTLYRRSPLSCDQRSIIGSYGKFGRSMPTSSFTRASFHGIGGIAVYGEIVHTGHCDL